MTTQLPAAVKLTVEPAIEQTAEAAASIVNITAFPEAPPVAVTVYVEPPTFAAAGAVEVNVTAWSPLATVNDCCACAAGFQFPLPAWFASTSHVPTAVKLTTPPAIEQTALDAASIVSATAKPEVAVAVGVYPTPPTFALAGAVDVNVIVWPPFATVNDCCACGAAL